VTVNPQVNTAPKADPFMNEIDFKFIQSLTGRDNNR
jgi:hypothetical protein